VVLDTNVLFSACWTPTGLEARITALAIAGRLSAYVTAEILAEYRDVLFREKFAGIRALAAETLAAFEAHAELVVPKEIAIAASDEDDNRFLECAAAANAEYLISGNLRHYPAVWGPTRIVNARQFFDANSALL
jgi:putative PIN family toxin of toxin-antitoxin system